MRFCCSAGRSCVSGRGWEGGALSPAVPAGADRAKQLWVERLAQGLTGVASSPPGRGRSKGRRGSSSGGSGGGGGGGWGVVGKLKEQLGLPDNLVGYSIFEVYDGLERNMLPWEKLGDALFKWAKYVIPFFSSCQFQGTLSRGRWLDSTAHTVDA